MSCADFLSLFSDYRDGLLTVEVQRRVEAHLDACDSCRRYRRVVDRGVELLDSRESVSVPDDFRPRLKHRIYHEKDGEALTSERSASGVSLAVAVGMAALLTAAAWTPAMSDADPEVRLPPIVVTEPSRHRPALTVPPERFFGQRALGARSAGPAASPLWAAPRSLLYEYSPLQRRYPVTATVGADLD